MSVQSVRAFSRFYTQRFGLLGRTLPASQLSLAEARVLYELAQQAGVIATALGEQLNMDKGQLSKVIARLRDRGLLEVEAVKGRGGPQSLRLSLKGRSEFELLDRATAQDVRQRLGERSSAADEDLAQLLASLRSELGDAPGPVRLAAPRPGDIGWVIHRQSRLYWGEYGWNADYEALITQIFGDYECNFDPARDDGWIGWCGEAIAGSIFLMHGDEPGVAKLRLLYVEPWARGQGLGGVLVRRCIERGRELGYRRMTLWTNDVLTAARRIYEREGFQLVAENRHHSFGQDLVGQTWERDL
jgi:DNA-binding MarR family transcriptional regulator/GNAT superfamily N-acetyltransferase